MFADGSRARANAVRRAHPSPQREGLRKLRVIADFQLGPRAGKVIFTEGTRIEYSVRTGRIRRAIFRGRVLATLIPATGLLALTPLAAHRFAKAFPPQGRGLWLGGRLRSSYRKEGPSSQGTLST